MESSRFIQISPQILIEYIYTDQAAPTTFNTATTPIELMRDGHTNGTYFFNTDSVSAVMGNYRDISAAAINANKTQYVSLNTDIGVPYNDFDPLLTDSAQLLQTFSPELDVAYDKMKIHFIAGFSFEGFDGIVFEALAPRRDSVMVNFASINFTPLDTPVFNPDPLLLGDKLYATYIEWRVPSLYFMVNASNAAQPNGLAYKITEGKGFLSTPPITLKATGIYETITENAYSFYNMQEINSVSILSRDIYSNLHAVVKDADDGDYFTLHGDVTGSSLSNFIATLNSSGGNYVVFYEIAVVEQVGVVFSTTSTQVFTQNGNFDEPILYRPIIQNANTAVSFKINLSMRLFNKADSTQIIKNASLTSFDTQRYGKKMLTLNLGVVPTVANVYNQINNDTGKQIVVGGGKSERLEVDGEIETVTETIIQTSYVTSFRDRIKVKAAISPVKIQTITDTENAD